MNGRAVGIGWLFLTAGLAVGVAWALRLQPDTSDPRVLAMSFSDPKIFVVLLSWAIYSFELYARRAIGWSGRRAAWLSALGFSIVLVNLVPVGVLPDGEPQLLGICRRRTARIPGGLVGRQSEPQATISGLVRMNLLLLGVSHHTAPVDLRERVDFSKRGIVTALRELARCPSPAESVVLTTCNRSEIYVACEDTERARDDLAGFMSRFHDIPESELAPHLYARTEGAVAQHLFRVAAGLDSLVVGEPQIFGQVKDAYATAASERRTGTLLNKLFPWSFAVGKQVRADTGLGEGAVSVSFAAISLARKIFGNLKGLSVLVIGGRRNGRVDRGAPAVATGAADHGHQPNLGPGLGAGRQGRRRGGGLVGHRRGAAAGGRRGDGHRRPPRRS